MSIPSFNFDDDPEVDSTPACEFTLGGRVWHARNATQLPWVDLPELPPELTDDEIRARVLLMFERFLVPSEVEDFLEMATSPRSPITPANALKIIDTITGAIAGRPTRRSSSSGGTRPRTGQRSKAGSSSRVTPKQR